MKYRLLLLIGWLSITQLNSQDTFSIVAVDTITGEVGSAGASCIDNSAIAGGAKIISDILPGRGAIHTQSYWLASNQVNAHNRMVAGDSPQQIIDWLVANDAQNLPGRRQYGIVDMDPFGSPRSAAYTGATSMDWKGHITGRNYAIQGNILLNEGIIDSMEVRFLRAEGTLSDKLMAALQGANVPGADSRCLSEGVSSLSAFIRMAKITNHPDTLFLDLNVPQAPYGVEPIDSLQVLYDNWKMITSLPKNQKEKAEKWEIFPNPAGDLLYVKIIANDDQFDELLISDQNGSELKRVKRSNFSNAIDVSTFRTGTYIITMINSDGGQTYKKFIKN